MAGFHSRTVPSPLDVASRRPSGLNANDSTDQVLPVMGSPTGWPVAGSHSRTVLLVAPASRRPSGLNATDGTGLVSLFHQLALGVVVMVRR